MLGFSLDFWDYVTFAALFFATVFAGSRSPCWFSAFPAASRSPATIPTPTRSMRWAGSASLPSCRGFKALIWAFKPTDIVDIRNLPAEERRETAAMIARLKGKPLRRRRAPSGRQRLDAMLAAILILIVAAAIFWLVFFKFKLLRLSPGWGFIFALFMIHVMLVFMIGLRFVTPSSANATMVQHTIQLIPRLTQPAVVTEVMVQDNDRVKKGQPLFQFDRHPYEDQVAQIEAQLAAARQNVNVLKADVDVAMQKTALTLAQLSYERYEKHAYDILVTRTPPPPRTSRSGRPASMSRRPRISRPRPSSNAPISTIVLEIDGVNTAVATNEAQLAQARYYLDNTTLVAPEDGRIVNLQVRPGMVSGIYRIGGIAALIADADRYLLATYFQENLKYVQPGQPVEVAFDLYPGQIFRGRVDMIWKANGVGPISAERRNPEVSPGRPRRPAGAICGEDPPRRPRPVEISDRRAGLAAIYTNGETGKWAALRKISIRAHSWFNWLYPMPF